MKPGEARRALEGYSHGTHRVLEPRLAIGTPIPRRWADPPLGACCLPRRVWCGVVWCGAREYP